MDAMRGSIGDEDDNPLRITPPRGAEGGIQCVDLRLGAITASRRDEFFQLLPQDVGFIGEGV